MRTWIPIIISVTGLLLAVGYNWRRVDEVSAIASDQAQAIQRLGTIYVRQDVHSMQLQDINRQLTEIKQLLQAQHGSDYGRRFDK